MLVEDLTTLPAAPQWKNSHDETINSNIKDCLNKGASVKDRVEAALRILNLLRKPGLTAYNGRSVNFGVEKGASTVLYETGSDNPTVERKFTSSGFTSGCMGCVVGDSSLTNPAVASFQS